MITVNFCHETPLFDRDHEAAGCETPGPGGLGNGGDADAGAAGGGGDAGAGAAPT